MHGAIKIHIGEAVVTAALASQMRADARLHLSPLRHPAQPSNLLLPPNDPMKKRSALAAIVAQPQPSDGVHPDARVIRPARLAAHNHEIRLGAHEFGFGFGLALAAAAAAAARHGGAGRERRARA
jgi:hypothetical protein